MRRTSSKRSSIRKASIKSSESSNYHSNITSYKNGRKFYYTDEEFELLECHQATPSKHYELYAASHQKTGVKVFMKTIDKAKLTRRTRIFQNLSSEEIEILQQIDHPHISKVLRIEEGTEHLRVFYEFYPHLSLVQHSLKCNGLT